MGIPFKKGTAFTFTIPGLGDQSDSHDLKTNPTIAAGDFKLLFDGAGSFASMTNTPTVPDATGPAVVLSFSESEANHDEIVVWGHDADGEWDDIGLNFQTDSKQIGDLGTAANQTTILGRLGAFTGSGVNTILGFFKALLSTAASTPSDVGGTFSATTDSVEAIRNVLDAGSITTVDTVVGDVVTVRPYTTWTITMTDLGSLAGRSALYFTVKRNPKTEADSEAILQVEETDGLLYINGAAASDSGKATLVVSDQATGDLTVTVDLSVTGLTPENYLSYDVKMIKSGATQLMATGSRKFNIGETSTRAIT